MAICIGPGLIVNDSGQLETVNPPACKVFHSTNQSLVYNTEITVSFDSEEYDNDSMHNNAVDNNRITFTTAGVYVINCLLEFTAASDYFEVQAFIRVNGSSANIVDSNNRSPWNNFFYQPTVDLCSIFKFNAGDYIEVRARQTNDPTATRDIVAYNINERSPVLAVARIGAG